MKNTVKIFIVFGVILLSACGAAHPTKRVFDTPSHKVLTAIEHIEDNVVLPNTMSLEPLNKELFKRYYALEGSSDDGVIKGIYIRMRDYDKRHTDYREKARVNGYDNVFYLPIEHLPLVMDGGCSVVTVTYDMGTQKMKDYPEDDIFTMKTKTVNGKCNGHA